MNDIIFVPDRTEVKRINFKVVTKEAVQFIEGTGMLIQDGALLIQDGSEFVACIPVVELKSVMPDDRAPDPGSYPETGIPKL